MAETGDNQGGRMLFTEMDVSDKGRPASVSIDAAVPAFLEAPLPSIADMASSLELDFEDDGDDSGGFPKRPEGSGGFAERRSAGSGRERAGAAEDESDPDAAFSGLPAIPAAPGIAWDDFVASFRAAPPARRKGSPLDAFPGGEGDFLADGREGGADAAGGDESEDVLSLLSAFPMGGGDARRDEPGAAFFPEYPGSRLGVRPPPARPYGGVERIDDWFVPPEDEGGTPAAAAERGQPLPPASPRRGGSAVQLPDAGVSSEPGTRRIDLFSDVDLDQVWDARLRRAREDAGKEPRSGSGDTALVSMFDDADLDDAWEERRRLSLESETAREDYSAHGNTTLIVSAENMYKGVPPASASVPPADKEKTDAPKKAVPPPAVDADSTVEVNPEPGRGAGPQPAEAADAPPSPEPSVSDGAVSGRGGSKRKGKGWADVLAFEDDSVDPEVDDALQPPVVDDSDLVDLRDTVAAATPDASDSPEPAAAADPNGAPRESAEPGGGEPEPPPNGEAGEVGEADAPPMGGDTEIRRKRRLTTADLLNDLDYDDPGTGVDDNVAAPVIDDSAINQVKGPKPGTEEMEAIVSQTDEGEDAARTLDPADVFADMDGMDFSDDGLDDDMRATLDEDAAEADAENDAEPAAAPKPRGGVAGVLLLGGRAVGRIIPRAFLERLERLIAWRENWWFYCDLLAAIIASGSLAVIISYFVWYRK